MATNRATERRKGHLRQSPTEVSAFSPDHLTSSKPARTEAVLQTSRTPFRPTLLTIITTITTSTTALFLTTTTRVQALASLLASRVQMIESRPTSRQPWLNTDKHSDLTQLPDHVTRSRDFDPPCGVLDTNMLQARSHDTRPVPLVLSEDHTRSYPRGSRRGTPALGSDEVDILILAPGAPVQYPSTVTVY